MNRQIGGGDPLGLSPVQPARFTWAPSRWPGNACGACCPSVPRSVAAALFAVHPIQAEAVNYVWARSILLAALLCFASLWNWLEGRRWMAVLWFALALLAKEEVAAFPLLLAWLEWRGAGDQRRATAGRRSPPCWRCRCRRRARGLGHRR